MKGIILLFAILLLFISACKVNQEDDKSSLDNQKQEIINFAKTGSCSRDAGCRYIGLGSKPCGGPWDYLVYSTSLDTTKLFQMISQYYNNEDSYNRKWGIISDCSIPPQPDSLKCLNGICVGYWNGNPKQYLSQK